MLHLTRIDYLNTGTTRLKTLQVLRSNASSGNEDAVSLPLSLTPSTRISGDGGGGNSRLEPMANITSIPRGGYTGRYLLLPDDAGNTGTEPKQTQTQTRTLSASIEGSNEAATSQKQRVVVGDEDGNLIYFGIKKGDAVVKPFFFK